MDLAPYLLPLKVAIESEMIGYEVRCLTSRQFTCSSWSTKRVGETRRARITYVQELRVDRLAIDDCFSHGLILSVRHVCSSRPSVVVTS